MTYKSLLIQQIQEIIEYYAPKENYNDPKDYFRGSKYQKVRLKTISEAVVKNLDGHFLEIGCHEGLTTIMFAEVAKKYNRNVVAIDPWDGNQQGNWRTYRKFKKNISSFKDVITFFRLKSQSEKAKEIIKNNQFAFCFLDGLHTEAACAQDIDTVAHHKAVIAVDDLSWKPEGGKHDLKKIFFLKAKMYNFHYLYDERCREGYYINL